MTDTPTLNAALADLFTSHNAPVDNAEAADNWEAALAPIVDRLNNASSSGLLWGGEITINEADTKTFDIAAGGGVLVNNYTDGQHPTKTLLQWTKKEGLPDPYLTTDDTVKVGIDETGAVSLAPMVDAAPTPDERRRNITLGWLDHTGRDHIEFVGMQPSVIVDVAANLGDLMTANGPFNVEGNVYGPSTGLQILRTAGRVFEESVNWSNSKLDPHRLATGVENPCSIYPFYRDGAGGWINDSPAVSVIDPDHYDNGTGTLALVPEGKFTIQMITYYAFWQGNDLQYGQAVYDTMAAALAAAATPVEMDPYNGVFDVPRCWLIVQQGTTDLTNTAKARFLEITGASGSGSGISGLGEANTSSSQGTTGQSIVLPKTGVDLPFKSITAGNYITVTNDIPHKSLVIAATVSAGPPGPAGANGDAVSPLAVSERVYRSPLTNGSRFTTADRIAYFVYLGQVLKEITPKFVEIYVTIAGTDVRTSEVGLFTTETCPRKDRLILTKIVSSKITVDSTGIHRNDEEFKDIWRPGAFLWAGIRVDGPGQPGFVSLIRDYEEGFVLAAEGDAFDSSSAYDGRIIHDTAVALCPDLRVTLD
jgi:hypothetical protein